MLEHGSPEADAEEGLLEDSPFADLEDEDDDLADALEELANVELDSFGDDEADLGDSLAPEDDEPEGSSDDFSSQVEDLLGMEDLDIEGADAPIPDEPDLNLDSDQSAEETEVRRKHVEFVPVGEEEEISLDDDL